MNKHIIITISLVLVFTLLVSPFAISLKANALSVVEIDTILEIVWDTLIGWGIDIVSTGVQEFNETVRDFMFDELTEFLSNPLGTTIDKWATGFEWIYDNFGRRMVNATGLNTILTFAEYLKLKYNLTDNSTVQAVTPTTVLNNYVCYELPVTVYTTNNNNSTREYTKITGTSGMYAIFTDNYNNHSNYGMLIIWSEFGGTVSLQNYYYNGRPNGNPITLTLFSTQSGLYIYNGTWSAFTPITEEVYDSYYSHIVYDYNNVISVFTNQNPNIEQTDTEIDIITGPITFPSDDPLYEAGMSIIYYPDGSIGYLDINWPETIGIDNLPAIVSSGTVANPEIQSVFLPIKSFINTFVDGFGLMTQLVYNLPSEIVGMALAIMGAIIIFGTIKIMKEH